MRFARRKSDQAKGEVLEVGGKKVFRIMKGPMEFEDSPFRESEFTEDYPERKLNPHQVGGLAYAFDKLLREAFGDHGGPSKEFRQLLPQDRERWVSGPDFSKGHPARKRVYDAIIEALRDDTLPMR